MSFTGGYIKVSELCDILACTPEQIPDRLKHLDVGQFERTTFGREYCIQNIGTIWRLQENPNNPFRAVQRLFPESV